MAGSTILPILSSGAWSGDESINGVANEDGKSINLINWKESLLFIEIKYLMVGTSKINFKFQFLLPQSLRQPLCEGQRSYLQRMVLDLSFWSCREVCHYCVLSTVVCSVVW